MEILTLKRDLPAIDDGRWVGSDEVAGLHDVRVKVRGHSAKVVRDCYAAKERALDPADMIGAKVKPEVQNRMAVETLAEVGLVDVDGLTMDGKAITASEVKAMLPDPAFSPLIDLITAACFVVDRTRVAKSDALRGNS